ncbi:serine protease 1 [Drosophila rhopaloa]|uniref:Serine proteases 1/2 n=1 Tax=Drosophila rhopaloa TaxID=1041015 RepID=A0A6P4FCQ4_DRORH|nr:serine protease 1 [Drosophila rhopaloa]
MRVLGVLLISVFALSAALESPVPVKDMPVGRKISGRITNGYPAYEGKVPYIVTLRFDNGSGGAWICGGSIIGHEWVLTAAHCTNGASSVTIGYGGVWRNQPQFTHVSSDFVQHEAYNTGTLHNDIALIRTPHVDFWSLVDKVELPRLEDRYNNYYGWWGLLSGWGSTSDSSGVTDYLNCVDIQIADNSICEEHYGTTFITPNHVCIATPENKGSCSGDSGGPLVLHDGNRQVAIVSFGSALGCLSNSPKGMTRVTSYLDWIRDHTGISY